MTLRVGLVGCGAIARRAHLPAFRRAGPERVDLVAFASRSRSSAEAAAAEWGSGDVVDDWTALVGRPDIDAVDICSPNRSHAPVAVAAGTAGKHVLVEKPMACTVGEADDMMAAAAAAGTLLCVAHNLRFAPPFFTAHRAVARGDVGRVVGFRAAFGHGGPRGWAPEATWFYDYDQAGGGALIDLGIHVADLLRFVLSADMEEAAAFLSAGQDGIEDAAQVILRTRAGAVGSFHASWNAHPGPDHQLTVFGTDGTLHLHARTPLTLHRPGGEPEPVALERPGTDPYRGFVDACRGEAPPPVTAEDGRAALAIVEAAYRSARSGHTEPVR